MVSDTIVLERINAPITLQQLCQESQWIVRGLVSRVLDGRKDRDLLTGRPIVYTDTEIDVNQCYKGSLPYNPIVVRSLGGNTPELSMSVEGAPRFVPGEQVVLFLTKDSGNYFSLEDNTFVVYGWSRGKYSVEGDLATSTIEPKQLSLRDIEEMIAKNA